jgi:hypothetical protein
MNRTTCKDAHLFAFSALLTVLSRAQWQEEFKRLENLMASIPRDSGYAPVALFVFWVPEDRTSSELRIKITEVVRGFAIIYCFTRDGRLVII